MGLAIAYGVAMSIPLVGGDLSHALRAGEFPGGREFASRLFIAHVCLLPALIGAHLLRIVRTHHSQFPGPLGSSDNVVGVAMTVVPNPCLGGVLFPTAIFGFLLAYPWIEQRRGTRTVHLLDRPRDNPKRTATGAAVFSFVALIFLAGSPDRLFLSSGTGYETQIWVFRIAVIVIPPVVYAVTKRVCRELRDRVLRTSSLG